MEEEKKDQCKATFTFFGKSNKPMVVLRCTREKHEDGKHEHRGISRLGSGYLVSWDVPKTETVVIEDEALLFPGRESEATQ